jgi:GH25 family lysozyme M1 (1,4-beta-N-acetylmuramidase)
VAKKKKKSGGGYLLIGILLGVILALAAVALWPEKKEEPILQKNPYEATDFVWNEGFLQCDGAVTGIDVSRFQGDVDWNAVKDAGVEFVFVRLGSRNSQDGTLSEDRKAKENLAGAKAAGLKIGAYFFSQAANPEEAKEEALDRAAVTADSAENLLCNLEFNTAYLRWTYVVEFAQAGYEYTIDIDAVNGDILNFFSKLQ